MWMTKLKRLFGRKIEENSENIGNHDSGECDSDYYSYSEDDCDEICSCLGE
jgi:hypothetical protein